MRRWIVVAFALVGASAFALSVQVGWWSLVEASIGPFGTRRCFAGDCREAGLAWLGGGDLWMRSAVAARVAGYVAMAVLVGLAGAVAARRVPRLVARTSLVAIATAIVAGGYFFGAFPGLAGAGIDLGAPLFGVGIVAGIAAAVGVLKS